MPPDIQSKILRAVEYQHFEKVGSNRTQYTDIRFIYATNRDLKKMTEQGTFLPDLLYRINTITIEIPPLRKRRGDIPLLLDHFRHLFARSGVPIAFSSDALEVLIAYRWTGNVRELMNLVENFSIKHPGQLITYDLLPDDIRSYRPAEPDQVESRVMEAEIIRRVLIECGWNQTKAADRLGMPRTTLSRKMKKYGLRK